ncbi:MAG: DUF3619 family protein [Dechloromonas sp.]|nr:DUF3619 family protein [Dechloromonas sp.]
MNEERYAHRIRQTLNFGLKDIPPAASRRLEAARHLALARQKQPEPQLAAATAGILSLRTSAYAPHAKQFLAIVALLVGMWISFYWHSVQYITELEDVDSALLTDDLPPDAFLDSDFFEWLKDDSLEE